MSKSDEGPTFPGFDSEEGFPDRESGEHTATGGFQSFHEADLPKTNGITLKALAMRTVDLEDDDFADAYAANFLVLFVGSHALERAGASSHTAAPTSGEVPVRRPEAGAWGFAVKDDCRFRLGRSSSADIRVDHTSVSREHARIAAVEGLIEIVDVGSRNGTMVNDEPLTPNAPRVLRSGDAVMLGDVRLVLLASPVLRQIMQRLT